VKSRAKKSALALHVVAPAHVVWLRHAKHNVRLALDFDRRWRSARDRGESLVAENLSARGADCWVGAFISLLHAVRCAS
jgi:hypothetical protein